ncbi:MAG: hypothetical protein U0872_00875 [Planctomycetaceae bacterium]
MTRYFVAANFWLLIAMLLILGRTVERQDPTFYSFFHGQSFSPEVYGFFVLVSAGLAVCYFVLSWQTRNKE